MTVAAGRPPGRPRQQSATEIPSVGSGAKRGAALMAADNAKTQEMPILTVEAILAAPDTQTEVIPVPEWGGAVKVIGLTKRQQVDIRREAQVDGEVDPEKVQQGIWREGVIEPRFAPDTLGALFDKNAGLVDRVLARILALSGMEEGSVKDKEKTFRP